MRSPSGHRRGDQAKAVPETVPIPALRGRRLASNRTRTQVTELPSHNRSAPGAPTGGPAHRLPRLGRSPHIFPDGTLRAPPPFRELAGPPLGSRWEEYRIRFRCRRAFRCLRRQRRRGRASALDERSVVRGESVLVEKRRVDLLRVRPERVSSVFQDAGGRRSRPGRYSRVRGPRMESPDGKWFYFARSPQPVCPLCVENAG